MRGMWCRRMSLLGPISTGWRVHLGLLVSVALMLGLCLVPASASAEPMCTDTWTGPSEGSWATAEDWSGGVPTSSAVACIGTGKTVTITEGSNQVGVLEDKGTLVVYYSSLEIADALEASSAAVLSLTGATLTGSASLAVTESLSWTSGTVSGSGSLTLMSSATATIRNATTIDNAKLVNEGTMTLESGSSGSITLHGKAELENKGTFNANSYISGFAVEGEGSESHVVNTGLVQTSLSGERSAKIGADFDNKGTVNSRTGILEFYYAAESSGENVWKSEGGHIRFTEGSFSLTDGGWIGHIEVEDASALAEAVTASAAQVTVAFGSLTVPSGVMTVEGFSLEASVSWLHGPGSLAVTKTLNWESSKVAGTLIVRPTASGTISGPAYLEGHKFINEGTTTFPSGSLTLRYGALIENPGTFNANVEGTGEIYSESIANEFVNTGIFQKTEGGYVTRVDVRFVNEGIVEAHTGRFEFVGAVIENQEYEWGEPEREVAFCGESVSCGGNFSQTQTDFAIGGRGVGLDLTRTYNSQAAVLAAAKGEHGIFGYGWSSSFSDHLVVEPTLHLVTLVESSGSSVSFLEGSGEAFTSPAWTQDVLHGSSTAGYTLTLEDQTVYKFAGATGRLESVTDRNGNATTLAYNGSGNLETITDPDGRKIKLAYNAEGLVESAEDPMKHIVKYTYEGGNLMTVTQPGESALRWQFKYEAHQLTELTDGRGGVTVNKYNSSHQVTEQTDPMKRVTTFEYLPFQTRTTNHATGATTVQYITSKGLSAAVTHGYGTSSATTESSKYNAASEPVSVTDGDGHTTTYEYENGNRTRMVDPEGHETKWTYDSTHDIHTSTTPDGETTTIERNSDGDPETVSRPAPASTTQTTKYGYDAHGDETSMESPLKQVWKYEYDGAGDRTAEIDPEGDKRTWGYNEDSQETSMVSPRGHVSGAKEANFTTTTYRDARGLPEKIVAPLKHETTYTYDGDNNVETETDPELNKTTYTYDADNERTKVKEPNGTTTETGYDGAGQVTSETDGNKHTTKYERNVLEQVIEVVDPLAHKTLKEYDGAGNLVSVTDADKRITTDKYNPDNRLIKVTYSDGKTPTVEYEYNGDGDRTKMVDGSGTTTYEYDQLDRLIKTKDGHGDTVGYEYNLANQQATITYPNGNAVTRAYDNAGRLKSVSDWHEPANTTKFTYDADSNLTATTFPSGTGDEDTYAYNEADAMSEIKMTKGTEKLASLVYTRNKDEEVTKATTTGLPGEEKPAFSYDENSRITKAAGITYKYDEANNPTTIGSHTYSYNAADELEKSTLSKTTVDTYSYDEVGERTKTEPSTGAATTYGYNQAGNMTSVTRAKSGETPAIEDTYAYNGDGLRTGQTISGTTSYLAWDTAEEIPLLLNDGTNSYIYGPGGLPVEQISSTATILYLHHDQQGSTRMLTTTAGTAAGTTTYDAYGNVLGTTGTSSTPFGYDGQYTNGDTGFVYLRARYYDPATAQFLTLDPVVGATHAPYTYAEDDPVALADLTGECTARAAAIPGGGRHPARATPAECKKKLNAVHRITNTVKTRIKDLARDERELGKAGIESHIKSLNEASRALEKEINAFQSRGCEDTLRVRIPAEVIQLAELRWKVEIKPTV